MEETIKAAVFFNNERKEILKSIKGNVKKGVSSFEQAWQKTIWGEGGSGFIFGTHECGKVLLDDPLRNLKGFYSSLEEEWHNVSQGLNRKEEPGTLKIWLSLKIKRIEAVNRRLEQL